MLNSLLKRFFPDSKLTHLWQNERVRALIKLPLWLIFILIIYLIIIMGSSKDDFHGNNDNIDNNEIVSFVNMKDEILTYNFDYKIEKNEDDLLTIYKGSCNQKCTIYKEENLQIHEYYEEDNQIYEVVSGKLNQIEIEKDNYLDLNYIFSLINDVEPQEKEDRFIFNLENISIEMKFDDKHFTEFLINDNNILYNYKFTNVGKVNEVSY